MKYLSDYMNDKQSAVFEKYGAFFAFSEKQFKEKEKEGIQYSSIGAGLIAPVGTGQAIMNDLDQIHQDAVQQDIKENGVKAIIHRELGNHEAQITMDIDDTLDALDGYGITREQVQAEWKEYFQMCVDNDYFQLTIKAAYLLGGFAGLTKEDLINE